MAKGFNDKYSANFILKKQQIDNNNNINDNDDNNDNSDSKCQKVPLNPFENCLISSKLRIRL